MGYFEKEPPGGRKRRRKLEQAIIGLNLTAEERQFVFGHATDEWATDMTCRWLEKVRIAYILQHAAPDAAEMVTQLNTMITDAATRAALGTTDAAGNPQTAPGR